MTEPNAGGFNPVCSDSARGAPLLVHQFVA